MRAASSYQAAFVVSPAVVFKAAFVALRLLLFGQLMLLELLLGQMPGIFFFTFYNKLNIMKKIYLYL